MENSYFLGKELFIVFKHVWTEDDGGKEYNFDEVFLNLRDAQDYIKLSKKLNFRSIYGDMEINTLIFDHTLKQSGELFWKEEYQSWINKGAFKSVSLKKLNDKLSKYITNE